MSKNTSGHKKFTGEVKGRVKRVLDIPCDAEGAFLSRENRFLGIVDFIGPEGMNNEKVHIHDPGRLIELLYPHQMYYQS